MIDPKNISTWPVVFIEKDDIETIRALSGFADWFIGSRFVPDNCFGFNEKALVVYARGDKETIADYCFGNVRRHNKSLMNEIEVVKRENNKLVESLQSLEIETERLRNYKLHLSPVVDKYNDLVRENVKLESVVVTVDDLRKKLATSEETVKETLAIKQALFDEVKRKNEIIEKLNNSAKGFGKQNDDFSKEIMLLRMMVENLQSGNACKASDDLKTANVKLVRENEHLKEKLLALQIINAKMAEEELKSRAPSTELEKENWKLHNEAIVLKNEILMLKKRIETIIENHRLNLNDKDKLHSKNINDFNNYIIKLRNDDGNHLVQSLQKGIERLKSKVAGYQNEVSSLREQRKALHSKIEGMEREINRLKPFEGSYDRWQLENRALQEKLDNIKKSLSGFAGKI